jgi:hypothetical protein
MTEVNAAVASAAAVDLANRAVTVRAGDTLLLLMPFVGDSQAEVLDEMGAWVEGQLDGVTVRFVTGTSGAVVQHAGEPDPYPGDVLPAQVPNLIATGAPGHAGCGSATCGDSQG